MARFTLLGSGGSYGVPSPGCDCSVCQKGFDPFAKWYRTRSSALLESQGKNLLVEASQDLREQAIKNKVFEIDSVLVTHGHIDAFGGVPDLRGFCSENHHIKLYANPETLREIRTRFRYAFQPHIQTSTPEIELLPFPSPFEWNGISITPIKVLHPPVQTHGFRFNDLAFLPDVKTLPKAAEKQLEGIRVLVLDATGVKPYLAHHSIFEAIALAKKLKPERTIFTHIGHLIEREKIALPETMELGFDGLQLEI